MGLAASQARLLTITARLADNELRSQTINNAKMRLATQSSQASENYISALNDATLKFSNYDSTGAEVSQNLTYNALTAYSSYNTQYALSNSSGQILVSEEEAAMFADANGDVNAYLKAHGLEYTTTYFDEIGNITNPDYPAPFNNITADEVKGYYEEYGSYEASLEKQEYENAYKIYAAANSTLLTATDYVFPKFLTGENNSPKLTYNGDTDEFSTTFNGLLSSAILAQLKSMFTGNSNNTNTYNINFLINNGIISDDAKDDVQALLSSFTVVDGNAVKYTTDADFQKSGNTYLVDDFIKLTVDDNDNVTGYSVIDEDEFADITINANNSATDLMSFVNSLGYTCTEEDGSTSTVNYSLTKDNGKYSLKASTTYTAEQFRNEISSEILNEALNIIIGDLNRENFADYLVGLTSKDLESFGISLTDDIGLTDKNLIEILEEYKEAKAGYLGLIFDEDSISTVEEDLKNNYSFEDSNGITRKVTADNLSDVDFILQYIKNRGLSLSEAFKTIVKEKIVDNVIEEYGEPKYAWVDENDTSNTGNADAKAQWYTNLFTRMKQGYKALENGLASSKEWIEYALESGIVSLEQVDTTFNWNSLDYKSCTKITEETDDAAVTKAEAEYNRAMNDIEAKDNIYDIELKNIDTEHTSLQTEYDVIKDVMKKNIERTFKFNQSA